MKKRGGGPMTITITAEAPDSAPPDEVGNWLVARRSEMDPRDFNHDSAM
jgi:hypothetical protein